MPRKQRSNLNELRRIVPLVLMLLSMLPALYLSPAAWADPLTNRSLRITDITPSASTTYTFSFTINNPSSIGSIELLFCGNSPLQDDSCTIPPGFDVTPAHTVAATGIHDFTLFPATTNELIVSYLPEPVTPPLQVTLTLSDIINPNAAGPYYNRIATYATSNATGPVVDYGALAFALTDNLQINSYVPPYLTFCSGIHIPAFDCASATGDYINFGGLAPGHSSQGDSQLLVATNAGGGYTVQVSGTTMTSGNNIISAIGGSAGSHPGSPQFGINLRANSAPAVGADPTGPGSGQAAPGYNASNQFRFVSNDIVASSQNSDDWRRYTVSYLVNVPSSQPPGVYASTLTYVCAGSF